MEQKHLTIKEHAKLISQLAKLLKNTKYMCICQKHRTFSLILGLRLRS